MDLNWYDALKWAIVNSGYKEYKTRHWVIYELHCLRRIGRNYAWLHLDSVNEFINAFPNCELADTRELRDVYYSAEILNGYKAELAAVHKNVMCEFHTVMACA